MTVQEAKVVFGDTVSYYMENNYPMGSIASTVVQIVDGAVNVLREGPISREQIENSFI